MRRTDPGRGNFRSVADQPRPGLARLTAEGYLDRGFDPAAGLEGGVAHDLAQQADGRILVGGSFTHVGGVPRAGLARLHPDGRVDTTFDADLGAGEGRARCMRWGWIRTAGSWWRECSTGRGQWRPAG
ncbi:MAG: delta-60 repeat domain-containing protein [Verrucomicrobia bacterium]|nr:delta-60 repeat domain-containing protein [Verrucomicrobiota bacterium]